MRLAAAGGGRGLTENQVSWSNGSIRRISELPALSPSGAPGVVRDAYEQCLSPDSAAGGDRPRGGGARTKTKATKTAYRERILEGLQTLGWRRVDSSPCRQASLTSS